MDILIALLKALVPAALTAALVLIFGGPWWAAMGFGITIGELRGSLR